MRERRKGEDAADRFVLSQAAFACPACREPLVWSGDGTRCSNCARLYREQEGIPLLLGGMTTQSEQQAQFFDQIDAEFEIERPARTPRFYRSLLESKFAYSVSAIRPLVNGGTVLNVCGGSGMEAEFLARLGARTVVADISPGAMRRARERARRHRFGVTVVVADVEHLPFPDRSFDLVYVHDGLHHLEDPLAGLVEMARVARVAVSVNEPARAAATRLAVRLRLAEEREEAGNEVARVDPDAIASTLETAGFAIVCQRRYAMVYRHTPGRASAVLSLTPLYQIAKGALSGFNAVLGGVGNKLTVQAVRTDGELRPRTP